MGRLAQWDSKVMDFSSTDGFDIHEWARLGWPVQPNLITKLLASADLNPSDGLSSDKILKFYIYIANNINWLNKNLKMHFVLYLYKEIRSDIETWSKKISHTPF